ncbi:MAG: sigma-54-dependent Fis family transcriptional regulator [Deltaproteobacteria bacterium]|nr:sigma-54-dependent Fis family transcriptional regulator [Deltaproteobacteria bacterium]
MTERRKEGKILVVDNDPELLKSLKPLFGRYPSFATYHAGSLQAAVDMLGAEEIDIVLLNPELTDSNGGSALKLFKKDFPEIAVVVVSTSGSIEDAVSFLKEGAFDFVQKPFTNHEKLLNVINNAITQKRLLCKARLLENRLEEREFGEFIGSSSSILKIFDLINSVAKTDVSVLIEGESGTGKELIAKAVHSKSNRAHKKFVVINCAALPETLLESELFGHEKGSFTGAISSHKGLFEEANGGTVFLDEIGEIAPSTQVKLLRVLQEGEIKRVGSSDTIRVNVRVLSATNRDLKRSLAEGKFREDLFYRLNVVNINVPPLRERKDDIPLLARHFLKKFSEKVAKEVRGFPKEVLECFFLYHWPGNIRELENIIERGVVLSKGDMFTLADLPPMVRERDRIVPADDGSGLFKIPFKSAKRAAVEGFEKRYLNNILNLSQGNITRASQIAGLDRSNLKKLLRKYSFGERKSL